MAPTILCADPDRELCRILAGALGSRGYEVIVAHDDEATLRMVRGADPDLLLVDVSLPGRDGLQTLARIRALGGKAASVPAFLLSGRVSTQADVERARSLGVSALLKKPIALDKLLVRIDGKLRRHSSRDSEAGGVGRYRVGRSAPLRGTLEQLPFPAILHRVHGLRASGLLELRCDRKRKRVELHEGRPAAIHSNLVEERLGERLVRSGRISRDQLAESARHMKARKGRQGEILLAMELLSESELTRALREQADAKLFEIFSWTRGRFELALGARVEGASSLAHSRTTAELILSGVRTHFPLERIDAVLAARAGNVAVVGETPFYSFQALELLDAERALLEECEAGVPIRGLLDGPEAIRRAAYGLLETGTLELRAGEHFRPGTIAARVPLHSRPSSQAAASAPRQTTGAAPEAAEDHSHYAADGELRARLTQLIEQLRATSPFQKLGVERTATEAQIRSAYTGLAKETHPDRYVAASDAVRNLAEEAFQGIAQTYEALSDPHRLNAYRADPDRDAKEARELEEGYRALAAEQEFQKGEARLRSRDWEGALAHFERSVELYPDEGEYHAYSGWAYYLVHGHDRPALEQAFRRVKRGAKLAPGRDKPFLFLGRLYQAAGRLEMAERMFTVAIDRDPDSVEAMRELRLLEMRRPRRGLIARLRKGSRGRRGGGRRSRA